MFFFKKNTVKKTPAYKACRAYKTAQSVIEFSTAFIIASFLIFFILECAMYYQNFHAAQTFNDEINANLSLYNKNEVCNTYANEEILSMINARARKYLGANLTLNYSSSNDSYVFLTSGDRFADKNILTVRINCTASSAGIMTHTDYLYRGLFIFKTGHMISSVSSVQSPKF